MGDVFVGLIPAIMGLLVGQTAGAIGWAINTQIKINQLRSDIRNINDREIEHRKESEALALKLDKVLENQIRQDEQTKFMTQQLKELKENHK